MVRVSFIGKEKYQTTILFKPEEGIKKEINEVLKCILWKKQELAEPALKFLELINEKKGVDDGYWEDFCKNNKVTRGQYDSIIKKLRGCGLIYKKDSVWVASNEFEEFLKQVLEITEEWRKKLS